MPEPLLYLKAIGATAIASATFVLAMAAVRRPASQSRLNSACVLAMGVGLALGYYVLSLPTTWSPKNGLDRLLTIVIPAALTIELFVGFQRVPTWGTWLLRISLAAAIPRILLHDSVYLSGSDNDWTLWQFSMVLAVCGALLVGTWCLLSCLSKRHPGVSIPLALCLTTQCAGLTVMMAGYIKGGAAAFPLATTLLATTITAKLIANRSGATANFAVPAILGIGVVGLFGLLFIGLFFGRLSTYSAMTMLLAPLLCCVSEAPLLKHWKPWVVGSIQLVLVAIPLMVVLFLSKRDFDRDMTPLLGHVLQSTLHVDAPPAVSFNLHWAADEDAP